ncbi:MAG TPA: TlpA disulfide reductase family protein [Bryobacteraceae bacterium]|nr:TlpA disulfide reductase family protein [Bryobacteraceae bacterium]
MAKNREINPGLWVEERLSTLIPGDEWQPDIGTGLARLQARREADGRQSRKWMWASAGAVAAAACGVFAMLAFPSTRAFAERCVEACVGESRFVHEFLSPTAGLKTAPDFMLIDASGQAVRLSDYRGKAVLLNFWATWCGPCKVEIPWFVEFERQYRNRGFEVLGVAMDDAGWQAVRPFIQARGVNYRVLAGNDAIASLYGGLDSLPTTMLIDAAGRIVHVHVGLVGRDVYEGEIRAMLAVKEKGR